MKRKSYFEDVKEILDKRRKKWIYATLAGVFIVTFSLFYFSGRYAVENQPELVEEFIGEIMGKSVFSKFISLFEEGKFLNIFGLIFYHNFSVAVIDFVLGVTFVYPLFALIANGVFAGFITGISYYTATASPLQTIGFFVVLFLELIATVLALVEGMYLSYSVIFPQKMWKIKSRREAFNRTFRQNIRIMLLVVIILLIAAIIETFVIYTQWSVGVSPIPF